MRYRPCVLGVVVIMLALLVPAIASASTMDVPAWSQTDPRWSGLSLGGTSLTMSGSGCAVTASAMVASYYSSGKDPGQLCQALNANGGLAGGELQWGNIPAAAGGTINGPWAISLNANNVKLITIQLDKGFPVLVWFYVPGNTHWVVLTGHDGETYYMNDPNGGAKNADFSAKYGGPNAIQGFVIFHGKSVSQYARHIVQQEGDKKKQKTSWYVSADLRRLWIPDAATFNALRSTGAPKSDVLAAEDLDALSDQKDHWAAAGSAMTKQRTLRREMYLRSANGKYTFTLRSDGNIELTGPGNALLWDAKVSGIDYLVFQKDGNLAGYKDGVKDAVWSTQTAGRDARRFVVRNDGVAAVLDVNGKWLWSTKASSPKVGEPFPICSASRDQSGPAISGDIVVWQDGRNAEAPDFNENIYGYDLKAHEEFQIRTSYLFLGGPAISGGTVVWAEAEDDGTDIYGYDLVQRRVFPICTDPGTQMSPAISGSTVVWLEKRDESSPLLGHDIYARDLASGSSFRIGTVRNPEIQPSISGNIVVWEDLRQDSLNIYGYDLVARREFEICADASIQRQPAISGTTVVWEDERNGNWDIYGYDLATGRQFPICTSNADQGQPAISGSLVAWYDRRNGSDDIYAYDLITRQEFAICTAAGDKGRPQVSGRTIVWMDSRRAVASWDIWGITLAP